MQQNKSGVKGRGKPKHPAPKPEEKAPGKLESGASVVMPFPSVKPDHIVMFCNRCGHRLTLRSQNPDTPGQGPYQGYCRFPCGVEYIVQVNPAELFIR